MSLNIKNKKIAIIGAGLSGLTIAHKLSKIAHVTIFDKSRGIGGRMTTRRYDDYHFDHGAQFFTAQSQAFQDFCHEAKLAGVVDEWNPRYAEISGETITMNRNFNDEKQHFVATPQMNNLCKYLARDLDIKLNQKITAINFNHHTWRVSDDTGNSDDFDFLILAIPSHQAVDLIPQDWRYFETISNIKMVGCFSLMIGLKENMSLPFDAATVRESIISWISINQSKPGRPEGFSLLVNADNAWAQDHMDDDLDVVKDVMTQQLSTIIPINKNHISYHQLHRWRYANCALRSGEKSLFDPDLHLGLCGDWFISGKVESAFVSGLDLYHTIINH